MRTAGRTPNQYAQAPKTNIGTIDARKCIISYLALAINSANRSINFLPLTWARFFSCLKLSTRTFIDTYRLSVMTLAVKQKGRIYASELSTGAKIPLWL